MTTKITQDHPLYQEGKNLHLIPLDTHTIICGVAVYFYFTRKMDIQVTTSSRVTVQRDQHGFVSINAFTYKAVILNSGYVDDNGIDSVLLDVMIQPKSSPLSAGAYFQRIQNEILTEFDQVGLEVAA